MGQDIEFKRPDGGSARGYLASAAQGRPAIIVIQEWWGLNDQIRGVCDRFAEAGYTALAPDLYAGRVTKEPDEASHLMDGLDFVGATKQDIRGAARHLAAAGAKVGVTGFCMGGALTISSAVHVPELSAAVCFYGIPPAELAKPSDIAIPFQAHFANRDDWCTPAAADALEKQMGEAGRAPEIFRYDAAHGFFNELRADVYDAACADQAWQRTLAFFKRNLG